MLLAETGSISWLEFADRFGLPAASLVLIISGLVWIGRYIATRCLDEDRGLITKLAGAHIAHVQSLGACMEGIAQSTEKISDTLREVSEVQKQQCVKIDSLVRGDGCRQAGGK